MIENYSFVMYSSQAISNYLHSPVSLRPRTWDIGGGTPAVTLRTWDMGGETPAQNLSVHPYYMQFSVEMQPLF